MFNSSNGYSLSDIAAVTGSENMFGGNGAWWLIILFILFCGNWGNFGGNGVAAAGADLTYSFDTNSTHEGIRALSQDVAGGFYALNTSLLNGLSNTNAVVTDGVNNIRTDICNLGYGNLQNTNAIMQAINADTIANMRNTFDVTTQINGLSQQMYNSSCETQRNLDKDFAQLDYDLATLACNNKQAVLDGTRDIIDASNANTRAILDFLTQDRISALQAENASLKSAASQAAQNAYLIERLSPQAGPAYIVANPYTGNVYPQAGQYGYTTCGCA